MKLLSAILLSLALLLLPISPVNAQTEGKSTENKGLFVSPLRHYVTIDAGATQNKKLTLANYSDKTIDIALRIERFSVANYTYNYTFRPTDENWVKLSNTTAQLAPGKSQQIGYSVLAPANASPGGYYFTIFATTSFDGQSKVQAASVIYITVNGELKHSSEVLKDSFPFILFGNTIPYSLEVKNTGNNHFFIFLSAKLEGLSAKPSSAEAGHILLPNTIRKLEGTVHSPILPGVYKATYGYKIDSGESVTREKYVLYIPPWSLAIPIGLALIFVTWRRHKMYRK